MKISEDYMQTRVAAHLDFRRQIIVPNVSWGWMLNHEADIIAVNQNNYVTEVEIKISFSDFKADFLKSHNHGWGKELIKYFWYAIPESIEKKVLDSGLLPEYAGLLVVRKLHNSVVKKPFTNKYAKPISDQKKYELARLGCMRVWDLKRRLNKTSKKPKPDLNLKLKL